MSSKIILMATSGMLISALMGVIIYRIKNFSIIRSKFLVLGMSLVLIIFKYFSQLEKGFESLISLGQSIGFVYSFVVPAVIVVFLMNKFNNNEFWSAWFFTQICCALVIFTH
ncbi:MAG: hypothetical protein HOA86_03220 [Gammaproteobacteria bacterium]|nr:hypothetical protein [Gammaproteobacteria bacterium]